MKTNKFLVATFVILPFFLWAQESTNAQVQSIKNKTLSLELEYGAGHMVTVSGELGNLVKNLNFGLSLGFDTETYQVLNDNFNEYLFNASGLVSYDLLRVKALELRPYARIGYEYYLMSSYSAPTFFFAPGLKVNYDFFFCDLALPTIWGLDKPLFVLQLGAGLRFKFDLKK